jgi:four helix bundle protein
VRNIEQYDVFKLSDELVLRVYGLTKCFPRDEVFALVSQLRRAAYSIPLNLVEGAARSGAKDFGYFLNIAIGSCEEARYLVSLAGRLGYLPEDSRRALAGDYEKVKMMLVKLHAAVAGWVRRPERDAVSG